MTIEAQIYENAKILARSTDHLCIANLQRNLLIGYNRAARLMEAMIEDGMVERFDTGYGGIGYRLVTPNVEFSGGAPLHGAASAGTQGYATGDANGKDV